MIERAQRSGPARCALAIAAAAVLIACGSSDDDGAAPSGAAPGAAATESPAATERGPEETATADPENPYAQLRSLSLTVTAAESGIVESPGHPVWAVVMDATIAGETYTLVMIRDDAVSLYLSTGGGFIGAGGNEVVRALASDALDTAEGVLGSFAPSEETPLPEPGNVRFYIRTFTGTLTGEFDEVALSEGEHELSPLYFAARDVITTVRAASPQ